MIFIEVTISGETGSGSVRHNNREFYAANVDRTRTDQNITFVNDDLKQVYHEMFDEVLEKYNSGKKKTRDKIPDYYEHIRLSKQEKLFHEAIFQIGNKDDCGCNKPGCKPAAAALQEFAESFQERNPHLRVFNMVLHMDEATPHLHIDFVPFTDNSKRGLPVRVSLKQALLQQGFKGQGRSNTEWRSWMENEKESLTEIAQEHGFEIISLGEHRPHMDLPAYKEAAQHYERVRAEIAEGEAERDALLHDIERLRDTTELLQTVQRTQIALDTIQPERTFTGAVKGVTIEQIQQLKETAIQKAAQDHEIVKLSNENRRLQGKIPSLKDRMRAAREREELVSENYNLQLTNEYLQKQLDMEKSFSFRLLQGIDTVLEFLEEHLPEVFRPLLEKAREFLPDREEMQPNYSQKPEQSREEMEL